MPTTDYQADALVGSLTRLKAAIEANAGEVDRLIGAIKVERERNGGRLEGGYLGNNVTQVMVSVMNTSNVVSAIQSSIGKAYEIDARDEADA